MFASSLRFINSNWGKSVKESEDTIERKIENSVEVKKNALFCSVPTFKWFEEFSS